MTDPLDDELEGTEGAETKNKPSGLRQALTAAQQENAEMKSQLSTLMAEKRKNDVAVALEQHGAKARLAKFYDKEGTSPDDVFAWLKENGEDFGWSEENAGSGYDETDQETLREAERINLASRVAPPRSVGRPMTAKELREMPYEELRKQGLVL